MNIVCIGAHPDDAEFHAGGTLCQWARLGHHVHLISLTNGDAGHHEMRGPALAERRRAESQESARRIRTHAGGDAAVTALTCACHDGELMPTLELRREVVRIIREAEADVVLSHRPWDYHPDHRYAAALVQDAAFMVIVPAFCPETPALRRNPVFLYMMDAFTKPVPFRADIAVDVSGVMAVKWDMLDAMESQFYEWLPWLDGISGQVPVEPGMRRQWLVEHWTPFFESITETAREALRAGYGYRAGQVRFAELFEICEYGTQPDNTRLRELFPFLPLSA